MASLTSRDRPVLSRHGSSAANDSRLRRAQSATTGFYSMSNVSQQRPFVRSHFSFPTFPSSISLHSWPSQPFWLGRFCYAESTHRVHIGWLPSCIRPNLLPTCGSWKQIGHNPRMFALLNDFLTWMRSQHSVVTARPSSVPKCQRERISRTYSSHNHLVGPSRTFTFIDTFSVTDALNAMPA